MRDFERKKNGRLKWINRQTKRKDRKIDLDRMREEKTERKYEQESMYMSCTDRLRGEKYL